MIAPERIFSKIGGLPRKGWNIMSKNIICPSCGGTTVNGVCLDCGNSAPAKNPAPLPRSAAYSTDTEPLTDVAAPKLFTLAGESVIIPPKAAKAKIFVNPYSGLIPFESPDYGENYAVPQAVIREYGTPKGIRVSDEEEIITKKMRISAGRHISEYAPILMLSLILPWQVSWLPAPPLFKFDEKGGRLAARIILIMTIIKFLIRKMIL